MGSVSSANGRSPQPLVIAHRGASEAVPEHTLAAYQQALADGADGWECDVRLTRDGHLVCLHDRRLNRTSNGRGAVARRSLSELERLDFASWKAERKRSGKRVASNEHPRDASLAVPSADVPTVLTLAKLLEVFVDSGRALQLLIETKHPNKFGGDVEHALVDLLKRFGLAPSSPKASREDSRVVVMSHWPLALKRIHSLAPTLRTAQLWWIVPPMYRNGSAPWGSPVVGPSVRVLRTWPEYVSRAREAGKQVFVWTADEPADIALAARLGADAIITNRPAAVVRQLQELV